LFDEPEARSAESWLTYSRCSHTYYLPTPMRAWFQEVSYRRMGWSEEAIAEYKRSSRKVNDGFLHGHQDGRSIHRLIIQESIFRSAAIEEPDWLGEAAQIVKSLEGRTILSLQPDDAWRQVKPLIMEACEWTDPCTIDVLDYDVVIVRPNCGGPNMCPVIERPWQGFGERLRARMLLPE
jgi:hypothetical protein